MLKALRERQQGNKDEGFTLIELMVVVLIIAILVAIAIPTFVGVRNRANDRAAQSNIRNALAAVKTFYVDNQVYTASSTDLDAIEPTLVYTTATTNADAEANEVAVFVGANGAGTASQMVILASESLTGTIFCLGDIATGTDAGVYYTTGCTGSEAAGTVDGWATSADAGW